MTTTTRTFSGTIAPGIVSKRKPNDPAHHSPHVDPARPGDDRHQSEYEQGQYLKAHGAEKNRLMKQFCKLEGPSGNSDAFQRGWLAAFGTPEEKAKALAEIEAEKACGDPAAERVAPGSVFFPDGVPSYIVDPTLPEGTAEFRDEHGRTLVRIEGLT